MRKVLPLNEEYFLVQTFKFVGVLKFLQNHEVVEHEKKNSNLLSSTSQRAMLHKVTTNNPQNKLARIKTFLLFNLSLSDDTFDTFSSLLLLYPLETHALQTFISFLLPRPYNLLRCFFCLFFCGQIHFRAVVKHCFMAQQNMLVVNTRQIMNWFWWDRLLLLIVKDKRNRSRWPLIKIYFYRFNLCLCSSLLELRVGGGTVVFFDRFIIITSIVITK